MDGPTFERLLTREGQAAIAAAAELHPTEETFLSSLAKLQKQFASALAKAALEIVILRAKARAKFSRAEAMYFIREALEQASSETISTYRAQRYAKFARVVDVCCGLGGDAIGLSSVIDVTLVDVDDLRLALAQTNLAAYGRVAEAVCADVTVAPLLPADALWFDPARRAGGRRKFSVRDYVPPLALVRQWVAHTPAIGVKLSPGVDLAELSEYEAEIEFISVEGELKECVLWFGPLRTKATHRATLLPGPHTLIPNPQSLTSLRSPKSFLYEPDPAILRAGLVTTLAAQLGAHQLDPDIAYLTADTLTPTPFARAFSIEDAFPFQLKRLRDYLRARNVGVVTVKKRGSPLTPEQLIHKLKLTGDESRIVFLTQVSGKPFVLIGRAA
ncbi:MAG: class I SAM-dependent methyltransferase [Anaerolineales bacterium]